MDADQIMEIEPVPPPQKSARHQPWVEKYRPKTVDDIAHQDEVVKTLKNAIDTGVLPHLLFYGPPGTGKTSTILAVAKTLFGPEIYRARVLELNASDERGIKVIREKVKGFAQHAVGRGVVGPNGRRCPPFKIVVLDEADTMTPDAQAALRRTMEVHSKVTRFCLVCNYVSRIIEPLASRCAKFRFQPLQAPAMAARLRQIGAEEGVAFSDETVDTIVAVAGGDMRKAVTTLQTAHRLFGGGGSGKALGRDAILELAGDLPAEATAGLWRAVAEDRVFHRVQEEADALAAEGYPVGALLLRLQEEVLARPGLPDWRKAAVLERLARADAALVDGAGERLQLLDAAATLAREVAAGEPR